MENYELAFNYEGKLVGVNRLSDNAGIPIDEGNSDYQQYLLDTDGGLPLPKETK